MDKEKIISLLVDLESDITFTSENKESLEIDLKNLMIHFNVTQEEMNKYRDEN